MERLFVEHKFKEYLSTKYSFTKGNTSSGIDFPDEFLNTDVKVTSSKQPQSSCPYENAKQKIYGLGYNLLILIYDKKDEEKTSSLSFTNVTFVQKERTGDYTTTKLLKEMLHVGANKEDIVAFLHDKALPGDEVTLEHLADLILEKEPLQGYLTISNALQWRLQYARVISLDNKIEGVVNFELS